MPSRPGPHNAVTDVPGVHIGHAARIGDGWLTGSTVVYGGEHGFAAAVDVRGGGPATRETDALRPTGLIERIHAISLGGGSAWGLDAAAGVMAGLRERGLGFAVGPLPHHVVPVVPAAAIFDLGRGGSFDTHPDAALARAALEEAALGVPARSGSLGAATGAITGGFRGGFGTASVVLPGGTTVGAAVVLNAHESPIDPSTGLPLGRLRELDDEFALPQELPDERIRGGLARLDSFTAERAAWHPLNTTLAVIATDAPLSRAHLHKLAEVSHDGMARGLRTVHGMAEGDVVFALSTGQGRMPEPDTSLLPSHRTIWALDQVLAAGADTLTRAIVHALLAAETVSTPAGTIPAYRSLFLEDS